MLHLILLLASTLTALAQEPGIHPTITGRSFLDVLRLYDKGAIQLKSGKAFNPSQELAEQIRQTTAGKASILSLGEGRSSFVYELLQERKFYLTLSGNYSLGALENIQAVDIAYPAHDRAGKVTDTRQPSQADEAGLDKYDSRIVPIIQEFPQNYHSQLFQDLDLRDSSGGIKEFSLIVSTYSLSYVALEYSPENEMRPLLRKVLSHLKRGGTLLMTPLTPWNNATKARILAYFKILEELRQSGEITDFNLLGEDANEKKTPMVLIK